MNDKLDQTQKILQSAKFSTDDQGRTVLSDSEGTATLELMSTQMLQTIIDSSDSATTGNLRQLADGESGLVARDVEKDRFEVISDQELQQILDGSDLGSSKASVGGIVGEDSVETLPEDTGLDLVSTQMLRIALNLDDAEPEKQEPEKAPLDVGFDPYNKS